MDDHFSHWKLHLGTDILLSSWCFIISTSFFVIIPVHDLIIEDNISVNETFYYTTYIISSVLSLFGSIAFLSFSYPDAMEAMINEVMNQDLEKMTFLEKYFIGNKLLWMTWFFNLAFVPLLIYYIWAMIVGYLTGVNAVFTVLGVFITCAALFLWVVACFPENLVKNDGLGSTYFVDYMEQCGLFCGNEQFWRDNMSGDFLAGSWIFFVISLAYFPVTAVFFFEDPTNMDAIMYLIAVILLVIGSGLFVHASYPGNISSDLSWRIMTCTYDGTPRLFTPTLNTVDERKALIPDSPKPTNV
jgi:hypothetical protein